MTQEILLTKAMSSVDSTDSEPVSFIRQRPVRIAIYAGLILFALLMIVWPLIVQMRDPDFQKHIAEHRVMVGMSKEQVLQSWGGPQTINTTFTKDGIRQEEWIFEDWESTAVVKHRYLYFEEGTLIGGWFQGSGERLPTQGAIEPPIHQGPQASRCPSRPEAPREVPIAADSANVPRERRRVRRRTPGT